MSVDWEFYETVGGLRKESISLCGGFIRVGSFLGIRKDRGRKAQGTDITLRGGPTGEFSRGLVCRGLAKALETGIFLYRGPVKYHGVSVHRELLRDS